MKRGIERTYYKVRDVIAARLKVPVDLECVKGWRDLMLLAGLVLIVMGAWMWSPAAARIIAGVFLIAVSLWMAQ